MEKDPEGCELGGYCGLSGREVGERRREEEEWDAKQMRSKKAKIILEKKYVKIIFIHVCKGYLNIIFKRTS